MLGGLQARASARQTAKSSCRCRGIFVMRLRKVASGREEWAVWCVLVGFGGASASRRCCAGCWGAEVVEEAGRDQFRFWVLGGGFGADGAAVAADAKGADVDADADGPAGAAGAVCTGGAAGVDGAASFAGVELGGAVVCGAGF